MTAQSSTLDLPIRLENSYANLPERFYARQAPEPVPSASILALNDELAKTLGLDAKWLRSPEGVSFLSGSALAGDSTPIAQAYAGHQFGGWVPQLGDGRAVLLGEILTDDGRRLDLQLKGSGRTPFSRGGDGKAWLGPVLREYLVAEAMAALGVPTTRALAAIATGETVQREAILPGALLVRVASSHIRVGTFQFFTARQDVEALRLLADYAIDRHHPEAASAENRYFALLESVVDAQVALIAHWQSIGFIHGVMNTDNMTISGETIDYGPCAFMDSYHPDTVFSSIDQFGRYAYRNQPLIAGWNLAVLASALLPILGGDQEKAKADAQALIDGVQGRFDAAIEARFAAKLGLSKRKHGDRSLIDDLLSRMSVNLVDFTNLFRALSDLPSDGGPATDAAARDLFTDPTSFDGWAAEWRDRLNHDGIGDGDRERQQRMRNVNPALIPRNHRVEQAIAAALNGDLQPFKRLHAALKNPYEDQPEMDDLKEPPRDEERVTATYCGT